MPRASSDKVTGVGDVRKEDGDPRGMGSPKRSGTACQTSSEAPAATPDISLVGT